MTTKMTDARWMDLRSQEEWDTADVGAAIYELDRARNEEARFRLSIGANEGESTEDALLRYTAAVQLGCALKLKRHAMEVRAGEGMVAREYAAFRDAAEYLRHGLPTGLPREEFPDAIAQWKAATTQTIKDGWLEHVFPEWWRKAMGDLPHEGLKQSLRDALEDFDSTEGARSVPAERPARAPAYDPPEFTSGGERELWCKDGDDR